MDITAIQDNYRVQFRQEEPIIIEPLVEQKPEEPEKKEESKGRELPAFMRKLFRK